MEQNFELEARILAVIRRKSNYYKYRKIIQPYFFQLETNKQVFTLMDECYTEGKVEESRISISQLRMLAQQKIRNKDLRVEVINALKAMAEYKTRDNPVVEGVIKDFVKRQLVKTSVLKALEVLDKPEADFTEVGDYINQALQVSTDDDKSCSSYFENPEDRMRDDADEARISSCIPELDKAVDGGWGEGELIIILAPPERGKTLALVNLGVGALNQGKTVGYLTMELSERRIARRFDLRISGRPINVLREDPLRIKNPLRALRKTGCDLIIKDYSASSPKLEDVKSFIINYQNRAKKNFDMLIVDYADLIEPSHNFKQERFGIKEVYTNLRRIANEFKIPIITASQANRKAVGKLVVTMEDFAEDFQKAAVADVVIALCQTPEELEENLCRLYIAKNRSTGKHPILRTVMKTSTMYLGPFSRSSHED